MAVYAAFCLGSAIYCAVTGRYRDIMYSFVFLLVVPAFYIIERYMHVKMPMGCACLLLLFMLGSFIGACYNVYTLFRNLDDVLHGLWGVVFMLLGFAVIKAFVGEPDTKKKFFACLLFAFAFSLMIAVFWEIYEFTLDRVSTNYDMQEDTIVNDIYSFFLYPGYDHLHTEKIENIVQTIIISEDGTQYVIEGGYLDIGITDTMMDIIWCTVASAGMSVALAVSWCTRKYLYKWFVPMLRTDSVVEEEEVVIESQPVDDSEPVIQE